MPTQTPQAPGTSQPQIDPTALQLSRSIRQVESGDDPNAKGKSGEFGIGQWMPGNFESAAKSFGLDPNDKSQTAQEHVLYEQIKGQLDQGHSQSEVASWWNSGKYDPTGNVGVNKQGVAYDTPAYVEKVKQAYSQQTSQSSPQQNAQGYVTQPSLPAGTGKEAPPPSFLQEASGNISSAAGGVGNAISQTATGEINPLSGLIQGLGSAAGGISGLINTAATHLPVIGGAIKGAEGLLGQGVQAAAQTAPGQAVTKAAQGFAQAHPEVAGDIG